jgi:hypothetical protein
VPSDVQRLVLKHLRPELERRLKRPAVLVRLLDEANKEILFVKTNGHRRPSDQAFMWDDDPAGSA